MASDRLSPAGGADGVTLALGVREGEGVGEGGRGLLLALPSAVGTNATDCVGAALELGVTDALLVTAVVPWVVHMQLHTVSHEGVGEGDSDPLVPVRDEEELAPRDGVLETEPTLFEGVALTLLPAEWDATPPLATGASDGVEYVGVADGVIDSDGEVDGVSEGVEAPEALVNSVAVTDEVVDKVGVSNGVVERDTGEVHVPVALELPVHVDVAVADDVPLDVPMLLVDNVPVGLLVMMAVVMD